MLPPQHETLSRLAGRRWQTRDLGFGQKTRSTPFSSGKAEKGTDASNSDRHLQPRRAELLLIAKALPPRHPPRIHAGILCEELEGRFRAQRLAQLR